jgi:uncharacterized DUF497 family protein
MRNRDFTWDDYNLEKIAKHGVSPEEAEHVVRFARRPYPRRHKKGTWIVVGRGNSNRKLRVIFMIEYDNFYIIHAMPVR